VKADWTIQAAEPKEGYVLLITFGDGSSREIDFGPYMRGPIHEPMRRSLDVFRAFVVDEDSGTLVWPNETDIAPDMLYYRLKPAWMEAEEAEVARKRRAV
jgi:hypothetical protein